VLRRMHMSPFAIIALVLILARAIAELWLEPPESTARARTRG